MRFNLKVMSCETKPTFSACTKQTPILRLLGGFRSGAVGASFLRVLGRPTG